MRLVRALDLSLHSGGPPGAALRGHVREQSGPVHRASNHRAKDLEGRQGRRGASRVARIASTRAPACVWRRVTASYEEPACRAGLIEDVGAATYRERYLSPLGRESEPLAEFQRAALVEITGRS